MNNSQTTITRNKTIPLANSYLDVQMTLEITKNAEDASEACRKYRLLIREHELRTQLATGSLVNTETDVTPEFSISTLKTVVEEIDTKILAVAKGKILDAIDLLATWVNKAEETLENGGKVDT